MLVALPLAAAVRWLPVRLASWPAAVASARFNSFAVAYPGHLASPGRTWGAAAVCWSAVLVLVELSMSASRRRWRGEA